MPEPNLRNHGAVGTYPSVEHKLCLELAREYQRTETTRLVTTWENQERAMRHFKEHGFAKTLDRLEQLKTEPDYA